MTEIGSPARLLVGRLPIGLGDEVTQQVPREDEQEQVTHGGRPSFRVPTPRVVMRDPSS